MFDNYVGAKTEKRAKWVAPIIFAAVALHIVVGSALIFKQFWTISELERPDTQSLSFSSAPPPPPPPPGGSTKKVEAKQQVKKVKEPVQPDERKDKPKVEETAEETTDDGVEGGVEGGVVGGVVGGVLGGQIGGVLGGVGDGPPPAKAEAQAVPAKILERQRISGTVQIQPPAVEMMKINRRGKVVVAILKFCIDKGGRVSSTKMLKKSTYPGWASKIMSTAREWKFKPFRADGVLIGACSTTTFRLTGDGGL